MICNRHEKIAKAEKTKVVEDVKRGWRMMLISTTDEKILGHRCLPQ
jgi:hypothetical protein